MISYLVRPALQEIIYQSFINGHIISLGMRDRMDILSTINEITNILPIRLKSLYCHNCKTDLVRLTFFVRSLGQADLWSDIPLVEASGDQEWYYVRSA